MKKTYKNDFLLKYGGYASVMTAIVVVTAIVLNLIVSGFNIKFDLTRNGLYTLSEDTLNLIDSINEDVKIYSMYPEGEEFSVVTEIFDRYAARSEHIKVENIDPYTNPAFATKYTQNGQQPSVGDVIVETAENFSVIPQEEVTDISVDMASQTAYIRGVKIEGALTGTIRQLINGAAENIYELTGHGETALGENLKKELSYSGFDVKTLDIIKEDLPEDCEILVINGPVTDLAQKEYEQIKQYLEYGGKAFITLTIAMDDTPKFDSILADYGIANSKNLVIEGSANYVIENNPIYIIPMLNNSNEICSSIVSAGKNIITPAALSIERLDAKRSTVNIDSLAYSSQYSYTKSLIDISNNNAERTENDPQGSFDIVVAITDKDGNGVENGTRLIVSGTSMFVDDQVNSIVNGGNFGFLINSFSFLNGAETTARTKSIGAEQYLNITQGKAIAVMAFCVIIIPLLILLAGFAVFIRRKNK